MLIKYVWRIRVRKKKEPRVGTYFISQLIILYFSSFFVNFLPHVFKKIYRIRELKKKKNRAKDNIYATKNEKSEHETSHW